MAKIVKRDPEFTHEFQGGITMRLRRLEPWNWNAASIRSQRAAAAIRDGADAITRFGFDTEEFDGLADPSLWEGLSEFLFAVELGMEAVLSWEGLDRIEDGGESGTAAPVDMVHVARLFRIGVIRKEFLALMEREGPRTILLAAEGNA